MTVCLGQAFGKSYGTGARDHAAKVGGYALVVRRGSRR